MDREKPYRGESRVLRDWARRQCGIWRFDAIEDRAVFELMSERRAPGNDDRASRRQFWAKYAPAREAFVGAYFLCLKWGRSPADLVCVLHG